MPTPIRGRAAELKVIGELVEAVAQGTGGVLIIEGPPGIGKSRLLTEAMALADKSKVRTLFGEAFEYQQSVPFFALFMATLRADPPVGDVEALRQLGSSADLSYWVVHDLADAIHTAAAQTPLAVVLEDIHWADTGTLLALRSLTTTRPDAAVLWVLSTRTGAGGPAVRDTLTALHRMNASCLRLPAIAPSAVADMVQDAVRAKADESLLNLAVKAQGNPFLVMELVAGLHEEGRLDVSGGRAVAAGANLPRRLGASMQQRLDLLSNDASELVRVASMLPNRFSAALLAAMLERQPASFDVGTRGGHQCGSARRRRQSASVQARLAAGGHASVFAAIAAPGDGAPVGIDHAEHWRGAGRGRYPLARSADPGDKEAIVALRRAAQAVRQSDASAAADLEQARARAHGYRRSDTDEWSPKPLDCSTGLGATRNPKSWHLRRWRGVGPRGGRDPPSNAGDPWPQVAAASGRESPSPFAEQYQRRDSGPAHRDARLQPHVGRRGWPPPRSSPRGCRRSGIDR
jgi:hypothetical protein